MKKPLIIIAGPCVVESRDMLFETAYTLKSILKDLNVRFYFKSSYKKANRSSSSSFTGIGDDIALGYLKDVHDEYGTQIVTDIHSPDEAGMASKYVDVLQIPAFLCRQTDLIQAAAKTKKTINIKKGQFAAPDDMEKAINKAIETGNNDIWLTERGTTFGYHDLVVDYRSLLIMKAFGYPVIYDATHSLQKPSIGQESGGSPEFIIPLAKAAIATGVDGIFFETHPDPKSAKSDSATQLPLTKVKDLIEQLMKIYEVA
jgi:2-dehydro-3-deoxyphosphooctonate aldolase (KDO 8-P synthase)